MAPINLLKIVENCSTILNNTKLALKNLLKIAQNVSKCVKSSSKLLKMNFEKI